MRKPILVAVFSLYAAVGTVLSLGFPSRMRSTLDCLPLQRCNALINNTKLNARKYSEYKAIPECFETALRPLLRDKPCLPTSTIYDALFECADTVRRTMLAKQFHHRPRNSTQPAALSVSISSTVNTRAQSNGRSTPQPPSSDANKDSDAETVSKESDDEVRLSATRRTQQQLFSNGGALTLQQAQSVPRAALTIDTIDTSFRQHKAFPYTGGLCRSNPEVCCLISLSSRLIRGCFLRVCKPEVNKRMGAICRRPGWTRQRMSRRRQSRQRRTRQHRSRARLSRRH